MPIDYDKNTARLLDVVSVEEAEGLLEWLQGQKTPRLDLSACTHLHAANLQVLMAAPAEILVWPVDADLSAWLAAALTQPRH